MTDKELKKLSRFEILELLLMSERQNAELKEKLKCEQEKVSELTRKLEEKKLDIEEAGNIAEAALKLQGIFESAQAAADVYLEHIKALSEKTEAELREQRKDT